MIPAIVAFLAAGPVHSAASSHSRAPQTHRLASRHEHVAAEVRMDAIGVTGGSTEYDGLAHTYTVSGHVKIVLKDMTVTCGQAVIYVSLNEDRVDRIAFSGGVSAVRQHDTFRGDQVTYFVAAKRLLAQGDTAAKILLPTSNNGSPQQPQETNQQGGQR